MKEKIETVLTALAAHDEQLMDHHGEGVLEGFSRELLGIWHCGQGPSKNKIFVYPESFEIECNPIAVEKQWGSYNNTSKSEPWCTDQRFYETNAISCVSLINDFFCRSRKFLSCQFLVQ